jgi:cob(I)alamin adenosyltransferase
VPRITKVYTRTGDDGTTGLGSGARVAKTAPRIVAYGTVDELNAHVGVVLTANVSQKLVAPLQRIQNELFHAGAELCIPEPEREKYPGPTVTPQHVQQLEQLMDQLSEEFEPLQNFVLPGGTAAAAHMHVARTICRRAERCVLTLAAQEPVGEALIQYLNRLSDALFVMARYENHAAGQPEPIWDSHA